MMYWLAAVFMLSVSKAAESIKITQTDGPTDCIEKTAEGHYLSMHYTGYIDESSETGIRGSQFDSSVSRGKTFDFKLGSGQVIPGWDKGLVGLCKGAKATLILPPHMGYGAKGSGVNIPGGATLRFDVEVVDFTSNAPPQPNLFNDLDTDRDRKLSRDEVLTFFKKQGQENIPEGLWEKEDKDKDGFVSWVEFSGPKGKNSPGKEL